MANESKLDILAVNQQYKERLAQEKSAKKAIGPSYIEIAALFLEFDINQIKKIGYNIFNRQMTQVEEEQIIRYSHYSNYSKKYILKELKRKEILNALDKEGILVELFDRLPSADDDQFKTLIDACLHRKPIDLLLLDLRGLNTLSDIITWFSDTSFVNTLPDIHEVKSFVNQERLFAGFKQQTKYFAGREKELAGLEQYIANLSQSDKDEASKPHLLVYGVGGIGKSTLIAQLIINQWHKVHAYKMPFVYLDFDKIYIRKDENQPFNPLILAEEAFRQLSIQFPLKVGNNSNTLEDIRSAIQYYLEDPFSFSEESVKQRGFTSNYSRGNLYDLILKRYVKQDYKEQLRRMNQPILIVLDSFEEFQNAANSTEFYELLKFIEEVKTIVPQLTVIIVGRTDYFTTSFIYQPFEIGPFDREASIGFLKGRGIFKKEHQVEIERKAKGIPLSLSLLANLVLEKEKELSKEGIKNFDWQQFYAEIEEEHLNEQLVIRNIEHISEEVRKLGIPGIIVRKITSGVIQKVLAIPCELGDINDTEAERYFELLKKQAFLLEEIDNELYFRRDLRESIQGLIRRKFGKLVGLIHDRAISFYENDNSPSGRAEYLYHRLMRGDGVGVIDQYYDKSLRSYIERSLWEFGEAERVYLYSKMDKLISEEDLNKSPQREWELYLISRIREAILNKGYSSLTEVVTLVKKRKKRFDNSPLLTWESKLYERLGDFNKVERIFQETRKNKENVPIKTALSMAKVFELSGEYSKAMNILLPFADQLESIEDFRDFTSWAFDVIRIDKRAPSDRNGSRRALDIIGQIEAHYSKFEKSLFSDDTINDGKLKQNLLPVYAEIILARKEKLSTILMNGKNFTGFLTDYYQNCFAETDFNKLHSQVYARFAIEKDEENARKEMGLFLDNRFKIFLEEISEPGVFSLIVHDFVCFLEHVYRGDLRKILIELGSSPGNEKSVMLPPSAKNDTWRERIGRLKDKFIRLFKGSQEVKKVAPVNMEDSRIRAEIQRYIAANEIEKALNSLEMLGAKNSDERLHQEVLVLRSRYYQVRSNMLKGILSPTDEGTFNNQIARAILQILDEYLPR